MLFTFLITIVFIAEIIIALTIILHLLKLDKAVNSINEAISLSQDGIRDISVLIRKISEQIKELSYDYVKKIYEVREEFIINQLVKMLFGIFFLKKLKKSKLIKTAAKGFNLLKIVV